METRGKQEAGLSARSVARLPGKANAWRAGKGAGSQRSFRGDKLVLRVGALAPGTSWRLGVVVSKKVAKHAVERNRIRRVLKEAVKKELPAAREGRDLILIVLPGFDIRGARESQIVVRDLFQKASLRQ